MTDTTRTTAASPITAGEGDLLAEVLEYAARLWTEEHGHWPAASYSTAANEFLWAAEAAYFQVAVLPRPPERTERVDGRFRKQKIPHALRWEVWLRDGFTCQECGTQRDLTADHVIPESKGGPTTLENLQTLCRPCNSRKGTR